MTVPSAYSAPPPYVGTPARDTRTPVDTAPGTDLAADLGAALRFAATALLRNPVAYLNAGVIYCTIYVVVIVGGMVGGSAAMFSRAERWTTDYVPVLELLLLYAVMLSAMVLLMPFALLWQTGPARAAEIVLEGDGPALRKALAGPMRIILTALLYGAIVMVGSLLFYVPGLIAGVLFMFAIPAAARGTAPVAALKESFGPVRANLATSIVAYLVLSVILMIGAMVVVGLLAMTPFIVLFELGM